MPPRDRPARLLYLSLEFCDADLFSGNGVCARSQVLTLAAAGHAVDVVCARPEPLRAADAASPRIAITAIPVQVWRTTDRASDHACYARGGAAHLAGLCGGDETFWGGYAAVLAVDWTGANVLAALPPRAAASLRASGTPVLYLNFRAYVSMSGISAQDRAFYANAEGDAMARALRSGGAVVSLCGADDVTLRHLLIAHDVVLARAHGVTAARSAAETPETDRLADGRSGAFRVLAPALRAEFAARAVSHAGDLLSRSPDSRPYLCCVVRLSVDKGAHRFVALVEALGRRDPTFWARTGLVPLLAGAASQEGYAKRVREALRAAAPHCVLVDQFVGPGKLGDLLARARLNVHPATYEAYGMTIVEAAAMGCPSVVHSSGIGAAQQLLRPREGAAFATDVDDPDAAAACVEMAVADEARWSRVAGEAFRRATSWTERAHVDALLECIPQR